MISSREAEEVACKILEKCITRKILDLSLQRCEFKKVAEVPIFEVRGSISWKEKYFWLVDRMKKCSFVVAVHAQTGEPVSWIIGKQYT